MFICSATSFCVGKDNCPTAMLTWSDRALGTRAHGREVRDGKLWMAVPPARMVFCLEPKTWVVEKRFATAGDRPH